MKLRAIKLSFTMSILDCLLRGIRRKRRQKVVMRLYKRYIAQLDVRRIISNSLAIQDFLRCFLTRPQLSLLARQRTRIGAPTSSSESEDAIDGSLLGSENPLRGYKSPSFAHDMHNFEP